MADQFNHGFSVRTAPAQFKTTLEIGAGLGRHLAWEKLTPEQRANYYSLEIRQNMADCIHRDFPDVHAIVADCQQRIDFPDGFFDRVLAIHVLEHLPNLPSAIREMHRLCHPQHGEVSVVIPCEGGLAYSLARRISAQRTFEKRYHQSYNWLISREHINRPAEIFEELAPYFRPVRRHFFPLWIPAIFCNLCIGLTLRPRAK